MSTMYKHETCVNEIRISTKSYGEGKGEDVSEGDTVPLATALFLIHQSSCHTSFQFCWFCSPPDTSCDRYLLTACVVVCEI